MLEIWTANLGRGVNAARFEANLNKLIAKADEHCAILLFQEIDEADAPPEHKLLREETTVDYARSGWSQAVPILTSREMFTIVSRHVYPGCKGLPGVTPHRVINEVVLKSHDPHLPQIAVLNTHLPLNRRGTKIRRAQVRWRLKARVAANLKAGRIVLYGLDTNTHTTFPSMAHNEIDAVRRGIDLIRVACPKGWKAQVRYTMGVNLTIDGHDAIGARLTFKRVAA